MIRSSIDIGELGPAFDHLDDPPGGSIDVLGGGQAPAVSKPSFRDGVRAPKNRSKIASVVARRRDHLQGCYEVVLRDTSSVMGELELVLNGLNGVISEWQVETNTTESAALLACVEKKMRGWHFTDDDGPAS